MAETVLIYVFCFLVMGVLVLGINLKRDDNNKTAQGFLKLAGADIVFLFLNLSSELLEGSTELSSLSFVVNLLAFLAIDLIILAFVAYLAALIGDVEKGRKKSLNITVMMTCARILVILVFSFTGHMFVIENGVYMEGDLYMVPYIISLLIMIQLFWAVLKNRDKFSRRVFTVIVLYLVMPMFPIILEIYTQLYTLTPVALTISILMVYVLIQAVAREEGEIRVNMLEELSKTDQMTGLNNRRAYYDHISEIGPDQEVGVIFCDVNGLKYTNDHFGHLKGDELLKKFANLLAGAFRFEEVFRISGDEFVVLMSGVSKEIFLRRVNEFNTIIAENDDITSLGSAYGTGCRLELLVSEAEHAMYEEKKKIHEKRPEFGEGRK